jgi:hypothetical protein
MVQKSPFFSTIATFNRQAGEKIDRARVDSLSYASLLAWFDGSAKALLVLGKYLPDERLVWYSAERQAMTTWGPFVLTLTGVEVALRSTTLNGRWSSDPRRLVGQALSRSLDYEASSGRVTVSTRNRFTDRGIEDIQVFDREMRLRLIREDVIADRWHHHSNDYWIDESGFCWKSRQSVIPGVAPINLIVTKPAKPADSA